MLSLPLFNGLGLMFVVAPVYRKPTKSRKRPLLNCPAIASDLLEDAKTLFSHDNTVAAAMTSRVEIERLLTKLAMAQPAFGKYWIGAKPTAVWLRKHSVIKRRSCQSIHTALDTGNGAAHGEQVTKDAVHQMFMVIDHLRRLVARKAVTA